MAEPVYLILFKVLIMNRSTIKIASLLLLVAVITTSCVSKKKYDEMALLKSELQDMLDTKKAMLLETQRAKEETAKELDDCRKTLASLEADKKRLNKTITAKKEELDNLTATCNTLNDNYDKLKEKSGSKIRGLIAELEDLQEDLKKRETRLAEVEGMLAERNEFVKGLRSKIADALLGFRDKGLTVEEKNGKVYVSLENRLLFASGSTNIDAEGQTALAQLAKVLAEQPDITIMVEGHTDNVPVGNMGRIKDNWDLSVIRSTSVVRLLIENGVDPLKVVPAGRGELMPLDTEETVEARAKNRRTEIILTPNLDKLMDLIGEEEEKVVE